MGRNERSDRLSRRDFLRTVSMAAAGAAVLPLAGRAIGAESLTVNGLPATVLGRTGLKVTKISFGGIMASDPPLLLKVLDEGINFIHTSPGYQNGRSIRAFGEVLKQSSVRDKVVLALKALPHELDDSLRLLKTDYADILVPPFNNTRGISDPSLKESFDAVKQAGKAGFLGWAGHNRMDETLNRARELGYFDATLISYANVDDPKFLEAARKANEAGMGIFTMKGLPRRDATGATEEERRTVESLCGSMVNQQYAHSVLATMGSFQSVDFYSGILKNKLSYYNRELEERHLAGLEGSYCSMCGACTGVCPEAATIPRVLRYRMYHIDYGLTDYARSKYSALNGGARRISPGTLERAESVCRRKLPLREMLAEADQLLA
ncbi:aldo/keto reductase [candidate division KSB1 bacterium]